MFIVPLDDVIFEGDNFSNNLKPYFNEMSEITIERPPLISRRLDVLCFLSFLPIVIVAPVLAPILKVAGIDILQLTTLQVFLLVVLIDGAHIFSTSLITYFDRERRKLFSPYLTVIPIVVFLSMVLMLLLLGSIKFYYFLAYAAIFHFVRQQYGWFSIACKKGSLGPRWISKIDQISIYSIPIFAIIWNSSYTQPYRWFKEGDLFSIPIWLTNIFHILFWIITITFILSNCYQIFRLKKINLTKYMIWLNTFICWYVGFVFFEGGFVYFFLLVVHHGLPYLGIIHKSEKITSTLRGSQFKYIASITIIYILCVGLSVLEVTTNKPVIGTEEFSLNQLLLASFAALIYTPQVTHYFLDMVIWKKKYGLLKTP